MKNSVCTWASSLCRKAIAEKKVSPSLKRIFSSVMVGSCKNWCSEWASGFTLLASLEDTVLVRRSHLLQPCPYSHSYFHKESLERPSPQLPATSSRDQRGSCVQPPHAWLLPCPPAICLSWCRDTFVAGPSVTAGWRCDRAFLSKQRINMPGNNDNGSPYPKAHHLLPFSYIKQYDGFQEEDVFRSFLNPVSLEREDFSPPQSCTKSKQRRPLLNRGTDLN